VFGTRAGRAATEAAYQTDDAFRALPLENSPVDQPRKSLDLADIRNSLTSLMWRDVGVRRCADRMGHAVEMIDRWCRYVLVRQFAEPYGWELQNLLTVARLIVRSALERQESRGVHFRTDFPELDNQRWNRHLTVRAGGTER